MDGLGAVAAAAIAALVSVVVTLVTMKRGDVIRAEEQERADAIRAADQSKADADRAEDRRWADQIRADDRANAEKDRSDDREQAAKDTQAALEHQAASMKAAWDLERVKQHEREGRATARNLLARLRAVRDDFESQTPDMWGYSMKRPDRNAVEDASLTIPDPSLRAFVLNTMEAIDHLQYAVERGMYTVASVPATQRTLLLDLMREVGTYAAANTWRDEKAQPASEIADAVERAYQDVLAQEEWERGQRDG